MYQDLIYDLASVDKFLVESPLIDSSRLGESACTDEILVNMEAIKPTISGIKLQCSGCVLLKASVNAICLEIENKTKEEALQVIDNYLKMFNEESFKTDSLPEKIKIFELFRYSLNRRECLLLGANRIREFLNS